MINKLFRLIGPTLLFSYLSLFGLQVPTVFAQTQDKIAQVQEKTTQTQDKIVQAQDKSAQEQKKAKGQSNFSQADRCKWGFAGFKSGFKSSVNITPSRFDNWRRIIVYNNTLPEMYAIALAAGASEFAPEQIIVDVRNPDLLKAKYCYELNTPPDLVDMMYTIMHQHLERQYPDYTASVEGRMVAGIKKSVVVVRDRERGILE